MYNTLSINKVINYYYYNFKENKLMCLSYIYEIYLRLILAMKLYI